jgi:hypothetical protein
MSNTESGRLTALQATIRACSTRAAIDCLRLQQQCVRSPAPLRPVANSESGRLSNLQTAIAICTAPTTGTTTICPRDVLPATRTIQTEGAYLASKQAACALAAATPSISAGGTSEGQRLRAQNSCLQNVDYTLNPDARFLKYQRVFPVPCPPGPNANNLPLPQPRFRCGGNQFPYS